MLLLRHVVNIGTARKLYSKIFILDDLYGASWSVFDTYIFKPQKCLEILKARMLHIYIYIYIYIYNIYIYHHEWHVAAKSSNYINNGKWISNDLTSSLIFVQFMLLTDVHQYSSWEHCNNKFQSVFYLTQRLSIHLRIKSNDEMCFAFLLLMSHLTQ